MTLIDLFHELFVFHLDWLDSTSTSTNWRAKAILPGSVEEVLCCLVALHRWNSSRELRVCLVDCENVSLPTESLVEDSKQWVSEFDEQPSSIGVRSIYKGARAQTRSLPSHPPDLLADEMGTMLSWGQSSRTSCLNVNDDDEDDDDQDEKKEWGEKQKSNDTNTHRQNKQIYACMHVRETEGEREKRKRLSWSEEDLRSIEVNNQQDEQDEVDCSRHEYEREYPCAFTFFDWTIEKKTFRLDRSEIGDVSIELMSLFIDLFVPMTLFFRKSSFIVID